MVGAACRKLYSMFGLLKKIFGIIVNRYTVGIFLLGVAAYLFFTDDSGKDMSQVLKEKLLETNSVSEARLGAIENQYSNVDMDASVRFYQSHYGKDALDLMARDLAEENGRGETILKLCKYVRENNCELPGEQARYIDQASIVAFDDDLSSPTVRDVFSSMLTEYADILSKAKEAGGETAEVVAASEISAWVYRLLCLDSQTASPEDWQTYCRYKEWMPDAVSILYFTAGEDTMSAEDKDTIKQFIHNCAKYDSMRELARESVEAWREAADKNELPASDDEPSEAEIAAFHIPTIANFYSKHGDVLESLCSSGCMPPEKALDLVLLNLKVLEDDDKSGNVKHFLADAERLWGIAQQNKDMEDGLLGTSDILKILRATSPKRFTNALRDQNIAKLCPLLLYVCTDENSGREDPHALGNALIALEKYGHQGKNEGKKNDPIKPIAVDIFLRHSENAEFRVALAKDWRSVPYLSKYEDGLSNLLRNNWKGFIDKDFEPDGTPKDESWIVYVPGGSLVKYATNVVEGYPCTWGELGWAVYDGVETAFVIGATLMTLPEGGSGGVAVKAGSAALKASIKGAGKVVAKSYAERVGKTAVKMMAKRGSRALARKSGSWAIRRLLVQGGKQGMKGIRIAKRWGEKTAKEVGTLLRDRRVMKIAAGSMFGFELCTRTLPNLDKIVKGLSHDVTEKLLDIAKGTVQGATKAITESVREALGQGSASLMPWIIRALALVLLAVGLYVMFGKAFFSFLFSKKRTTPPGYT